ncbi:MAG: RsmD family RNA methyltransferase [Prevotella sp.]
MDSATRDFIRQHADEDVKALALKAHGIEGVDLKFALDQIAGRQTARHKLPTWAAIEGILFPPHISMEQCSSEATALYKQNISLPSTPNLLPSTMVDLTGGFGVDFSFLARNFSKAIYVERQQHLCDIARENFRLLDLKQAEVVCDDAESFLKTMPHVDLIYLDPARRDNTGARTFAISDCTPDAVSLRDSLLQKADRVMLKLSPMLDWRKAVSDLGEKNVSEVHVVSVNNECKELLIVMTADETKGMKVVGVDCISRSEERGVRSEERGVRSVECGVRREERGVRSENSVNAAHCYSYGNLSPHSSLHTPHSTLLTPHSTLHTPHSTLHTPHSSLHTPHSSLHTPHSSFLYEPNSSIMKIGCFDQIAERFGICQVAKNSHLFLSDHEVDDFPGRSFSIVATTTMNKRELKAALADVKTANIAVRNFPLSAAELRKRLKLKDGGDTYIFATTDADKQHKLFICKKTNKN